jgi:TetR/AcrR family transcriptional regulator, ethionamide resistance regulator
MAVLAREPDSAERRRESEAAFLAATESLLAEGSSFAELSVERIAAAAGRSRTAFYLYFPDKRELLMRLTETVAEQLYEVADRWWSGPSEGGRGRAELRAALTQIMRAYGEHRDLLRAVVEAATYDDVVASFWRELVGRFIEATERRLIAEGTDQAAARGRAFALVWMTERACYQQIVRGGALDEPEILDALTEIWSRTAYGT